MWGKSWAQTVALAVTIAASAAFGAVVAVNLTDSDTASPRAAVAAATAESLPVARVTAPAPTETGAAPAAAASALPDVVDDVRRSVVDIMTATGGTTSGPFDQQRDFRSQGEGTGIVIDRDGHILTNYHVIQDADEVTVTLWDGTVVTAQVVGVDPGNDLAVIRASLQPQRLFPARFGDSDAVRVGEPVFAIGNPFSFDFSVTQGIVSGVGRESSQNSSGRSIRGVIQIDAAVNPGNSGGPLFNARGEVIGINTAIHNPTQQRVFVGVGLAVPSNTAVRFIPDMIAGRDIAHPQLGISGVTLNTVNARDAGVDVEYGVYLLSVGSGTAADRAGLRAASVADGGAVPAGGDVIAAIDGVEVLTIQELARVIDRHDVGDEITLTVIRRGEQIEIVVTLREWDGG